jgi:hypothetical protein
MHIFIEEIGAESSPFNGAIWDKLSELHQHQSTKKRNIFNAQFTLFLVQIRRKYDAYFGWVPPRIHALQIE